MPQWLEKARAALRGTSDEPQPFDVRCGCGHRLSGIREHDFQTRNCPRCGLTAFILPADVYPQVIPRAPKASPKPAAQPAVTAKPSSSAAPRPESDGLVMK